MSVNGIGLIILDQLPASIFLCYRDASFLLHAVYDVIAGVGTKTNVFCIIVELIFTTMLLTFLKP